MIHVSRKAGSIMRQETVLGFSLEPEIPWMHGSLAFRLLRSSFNSLVTNLLPWAKNFINVHKLFLPQEKRQKMKCSLVLTVLLSLLVAKLCRGYCIESQEQQRPSGIQTKKNSDLYKLPLSLLRRLYDGQGISYEALLRLSGKEEISPQSIASSQKRDMHDFFVGLMGKRTTEPDNSIEFSKEAFAGLGDVKYSPNAE
ncbi:tachykinin-3 isoform X2 [Python bivittatus]|uniref:Tachykinin-3 isoform X2 n=1 Tax=Python bivittatus TaxID=176946 RepID=A0A9F5N2H8_PYTBI|nr:tachykinin-3 isoform X2 [Python bivittatus]